MPPTDGKPAVAQTEDADVPKEDSRSVKSEKHLDSDRGSQEEEPSCATKQANYYSERVLETIIESSRLEEIKLAIKAVMEDDYNILQADTIKEK